MNYILFLFAFLATAVAAEPLEVHLAIQNHLFIPDVLKIPARKKVRLRIVNEDDAAEEFESYPLNREKIVPGKGEVFLFIGPLEPGEYAFFGEFHPTTAQGKIVVE